MLPFYSNPECSACELCHAGCKSICIPAHEFVARAGTAGADQCVLFVDEAPGANEDEQRRNFVGASGELLDELYVYGIDLPSLVDTYVANAVRCRPPGNATPSRGMVKACLPYLHRDLSLLSAAYRCVIVLACGATPAQALCGKSVTDWQKYQASVHPGYSNVYLFATWHPAYLLRNPAEERKVKDVLRLMREFIVRGEIREEEQPPTDPAQLPPDDFSGPLCLDIETDACLKHGRQTTFHPRKVQAFDKVRPEDMIVCVSIAWRDSSGAIRTNIFRRKSPADMEMLRAWLRRVVGAGGEIWGQNLSYDLKFLRADPLLRGLIPAFTPLRDLMTATFLLDDAQERGLKVVGWLHRITSFRDDPDAFRAYVSSACPELLHYCCKDSWATYRGIEIADAACAERFQRHPVASSKCSAQSRAWYSDQAWAAILMEEHGTPASLSSLRRLRREVLAALAGLQQEADAYDLRLRGRGSDASKRAVVDSSVAYLSDAGSSAGDEELLTAVQALPRTEKRGEVCADADTRNLLLGMLPVQEDTEALRRQLSLMSEAAVYTKLLTAYVEPLLFGRRKKEIAVKQLVKVTPKKGPPRLKLKKVGTRIIRDLNPKLVARAGSDLAIAYPSIYVLPRASDDYGGKGGGVRQFRWSMKDPPMQTLPEPVFRCLQAPPGWVLWKVDLAQMEWRMAAFLANDKVMLREIRDGVDIHSRTAQALLGVPFSELPAWVDGAGARYLRAAPDLAIRRAFTAYGNGELSKRLLLEGNPDEHFMGVKKWLRQEMGKSQNFAELYGAKTPIIVTTCRIKAGIDIPRERCDAWYHATQELYYARTAWRQSLLDAVKREYALHLPLRGQSRTFCADEEAIEGLYRPQILDFPVQAQSSNVLVAALIGAAKEYLRRRMRTRLCLNIHDAAVGLSPQSEYDEARAIFDGCLKESEYLQDLQSLHGREFPLGFEAEIVHTGNVQ